MSTIKRCISLLLVLGILFGVLAPAAQAAPVEDAASVNTDNVTIEGTNGFGNLLSREITESQEEAEAADAEYPGGYTVTDLVIEGSTATVTYDTMEEATLVVALYTEDGMQMLTSTTATVTPDAMEAELTFEGEMPEYFLASAYLLDSYDLSPLCAAYDTPMYTREMQELLASTVNDYDPEKVLNLDEDETTNFAVYADSTIVIEAVDGKNTVTAVDDENATYVIENVDEQITSLVAGDVVAYPYTENEILVIKIAEIEILSNKVTITGTELEMEEVFTHVKIENTSSSSDIIVDEDSCEEGITVNSTPSNGAIQPNAFEENMGGSGHLSFNIFKEFEDKNVGSSIELKGTLDLGIEINLSFYVSWNRQYVSLRADSAVTLSGSVTGKIAATLDLPDLAVTPIPGVKVGFFPQLKVEFNGELIFEVSIRWTVGAAFSSDHGFVNLTTKPELDPNINLKADLFIGVDLYPGVEVFSGNVAKLKIKTPVGIKFECELNKDQEIQEALDIHHDCKLCIAGSISFIAELGAELTFLKCSWLKFEEKFKATVIELGLFYYSEDQDEFGFGTCPYCSYRTTIQVTNLDDIPVPSVQVDIEGYAPITVNEHGVQIVYLPAGEYRFTTTVDDVQCLTIGEIPYEQKIILSPIYESITNTTDGPEVNFGEVSDEEIVDNTTSFEGHVYRVINMSATWTEAKEYCTRYGGHLVTISSQEEMDAVLDLLPNSPKLYYWIGLYRNSVDNAWEWVTDEVVTYLNWADGEPNDYSDDGENCAHLYTESNMFGQWNDEQDSAADLSISNMGFICEWESSDQVPNYAERYQIIHKSMTWNNAKAYCESVGGHLATITSAEEQEIIEIMNENRSSLWIGGYRDDDFNWHWVTGEPWGYSNWENGEPNNYNNEENYVAMWPLYWNDLPGGNFVLEGCVCEFENTNETTACVSNHPNYTPNALYPGDYGTEVTDTYILKTAAFRDLVPNEQYVLLAMVSVEAEDPLASDNLLFIDQAEAAEDGTLTFRYVQRTPCDISYVVACGASHKNLNDAEISFPKMVADGELQVVDPVVVYDGVTLTEGRDYVIVGSVDFTEAGEYTCYIRGIHNYTGSVECI